MGKKKYVDMYEGAWRPEDMDGIDAKLSEAEEAEEMDGMRIFDPEWSDDFIEQIALMYDDALNDGFSEEESIEEVAAQTGYSVEEIRAILEEGSARLQDTP